MTFYVLASAFSAFKDIMAVFGGFITIAATVFGIWLALRKRAETKRRQERDDNMELSGKFATLETKVDYLRDAADGIERQYKEFRDSALQEQQELMKQLQQLRTRSDQYQKEADVDSLRSEVRRIQDHLRRLDEDFRHHRDMVLEKYLTLASYQNDLLMWTKSFDDLRQSLRDVQQTLTKRI